jgi:hypothetical protein
MDCLVWYQFIKARSRPLGVEAFDTMVSIAPTVTIHIDPLSRFLILHLPSRTYKTHCPHKSLNAVSNTPHYYLFILVKPGYSVGLSIVYSLLYLLINYNNESHTKAAFNLIHSICLYSHCF